MAQAVSRRPLTAEARVRARVNPCGIYGSQNGTRTGFSTSSSVFSCQYHSTVALQTHIIWEMNDISFSGNRSDTSHPIEINQSINQSMLYSRTDHVLPLGRDPRYPLYRRLGGPQSRSGNRGYKKNSLPLPGIESRSSSL
jgi:hypothetical protein